MGIFVAYDTSERVYSLRLQDEPTANTVEVDDVHIVDLDQNGAVVAIEVLDPVAADLAMVAERFGLNDQLEEMLAAVRGTVPTLVTGTAARADVVRMPLIVFAHSLYSGAPSSAPVQNPAQWIELVEDGVAC